MSFRLLIFSCLFFVLGVAAPALASAAPATNSVTSNAPDSVTITGSGYLSANYVDVKIGTNSVRYYRPDGPYGYKNPAGAASIIWSDTSVTVSNDLGLAGKVIQSITFYVSGPYNYTLHPPLYISPKFDSAVMNDADTFTITGSGFSNASYIALVTPGGTRIYYNPTSAGTNPAGVTVESWSNTNIQITDTRPSLAGLSFTSLEYYGGNPTTVGATAPVALYFPGALSDAVSNNPEELTVTGTVMNTLDALRINSTCGSIDIANDNWDANSVTVSDPSLGGCTVQSVQGIKFGEVRVTLDSLNVAVQAAAAPVTIDFANANSSGTLFVNGQGFSQLDQVRLTTSLGVVTKNIADLVYADDNSLQITNPGAWDDGVTVTKIEGLASSSVKATYNDSVFVAPATPVLDNAIYTTTRRNTRTGPTTLSLMFNNATLASTTATNITYFSARATSDGTKVAYLVRTGSSSSAPALVVSNADGSNKKTLQLPNYAVALSWAPNKNKIAFLMGADTACSTYCLFTVDVASDNTVSAVTKLTDNANGEDNLYSTPTWTADSQHILSSIGIPDPNSPAGQTNYNEKPFVISATGGAYTFLTLPGATNPNDLKLYDGYLFYVDGTSVNAIAVDANGTPVVGATVHSVNVNLSTANDQYTIDKNGSNYRIIYHDVFANNIVIKTIMGTGTDTTFVPSGLTSGSSYPVFITQDHKWLIYGCTIGNTTNVCGYNFASGYRATIIAGPSNNPPNTAGSLFLSVWGGQASYLDYT